MKNDEFIKSFVRLKPIIKDEYPAFNFNDRQVFINKPKETYFFNKVFGDSSQNEDIYNYAVKPVMNDLMNGYNACVLAYGQTSSGKTFTMKGESQSPGLIPLSIKELFRRINEGQLYAKVSISYFQIYNQNIIDLLNNDQSRYLDLREDGKKNLVIVDLIEQKVSDEFEATAHYEKGEMQRKFACNNINFSSSRSHTIFKITLSTVTEERALVESSIYMVDLAGSESISKTNAVGVLKKQAQNINKSLLALTTAIRAISERQAYVNYRNSKLTRILQPCLSGNSKTVVICTAKQTDDCLPQTVNTLKFGVSANSIRTEARQNVVQTPYESQEGARYKSLCDILEEERAQRAKVETELVLRCGQLQVSKQQAINIQAELQECKHKLFALENENKHHSGLVGHYKGLKQMQKTNKNFFYEKSQEGIALLQNQNKNLKLTVSTLNETIQKRNKKIVMLEKNQRFLLDKVEKYEKELAKLQQMIGQEEQKYQQQQQNRREDPRLRSERRNNESSNTQHKKQNQKQLNFHEMSRCGPSQSGQLSHPFTIGTVVSLSTTILTMKIDMNHYLNTITELHAEINELQAKLDGLRRGEEMGGYVGSSGGLRRESGVRSKEDDRKARKMDNRLQELKQENQKLRKKNVNYLKILKKCANNNIDSIVGFNEYLQKNFKFDQRALFEQLMQQNADDYEPITSSEPTRNRDQGPSKENRQRSTEGGRPR